MYYAFDGDAWAKSTWKRLNPNSPWVAIIWEIKLQGKDVNDLSKEESIQLYRNVSRRSDINCLNLIKNLKTLKIYKKVLTFSKSL